MDIIVFLGVMIQWPWLALVPACAFALAWVRCRRASILVAALAWLAYFGYELPSEPRSGDASRSRRPKER